MRVTGTMYVALPMPVMMTCVSAVATLSSTPGPCAASHAWETVMPSSSCAVAVMSSATVTGVWAGGAARIMSRCARERRTGSGSCAGGVLRETGEGANGTGDGARRTAGAGAAVNVKGAGAAVDAAGAGAAVDAAGAGAAVDAAGAGAGVRAGVRAGGVVSMLTATGVLSRSARAD